MTPEKRLALIVRIVNLLRAEIERNGNRYDGSMIPNLTSITDCATIDSAYLLDAEHAIITLETQRGVVGRFPFYEQRIQGDGTV